MIKKLLKIIFAIVMLCLATKNLVRAQSVSNEGQEFFSVFPTHVPNMPTQLANISIFITGKQASSGTVSVNGYSQKFTVIANTVSEIQVPRASAYINDIESGRVLANRAIHIVVDAGQPNVVVYAHIFAGARSAASLILPIKALGQQYYSMNYTQSAISGGQNYITVIASEANTKVFLRRGTTDLVAGGITLPNIGDVYEYLSYNDLSGVSVSVDPTTSGCKRFAMFSGSSGDAINDPTCTPHSIDPLYQQDYPIESWGKTYGFIPFSMAAPGSIFATERTLGQYVRVVAQSDNTNVQINGVTVATLNTGGFYTTPSPLSQPASISADKPISVAQYALTEGCSDKVANAKTLGDPDMVILNPIEYSIKNITVYSSTRENISEQYINVLIKTAAAASFRINGVAPIASFAPLSQLTGYSYLQLNLNSYRTNNFNLTADDGFNAIAYGFGAVESYSYSAGTNLATTLTATAVDPVTNLPIVSACVYDNDFLQLTLNVPTKKIVWTITPSNIAPIISINPVARDTTINGQPYYVYKIPKPVPFFKAGVYAVNIVADLPPSTGGCTIGDQNFNFPFTVYSAPVTAFTMPASVCAGDSVKFIDKSSDSSKTVKSWIWKFGDGTTSTLQNPTHTYTIPGTDTVSLTAISESGCQTTKQQTIKINNVPNAVFTYTNSVFKDFAVLLKDASTIASGKIVQWIWNFGDGKTETRTDAKIFEHDYAAAGTYQVTLTVISDQGCPSVITQSVIAKPGIKPDFKLPEVCSADLTSQFTDLTADSVVTGTNLTYLWNFGDADATASNPNTSTLKNPTHQFLKAQVYQITETVTADDGSSATVTIPFQVNGSLPKAAFNILSTGNLCSSSPVIFQNESSVDVGKITKLEWYFDYLNQPTVVLTDENPVAGQQYSHQYDAFNTPASKTYTIRLLAYSGITCVDVVEKIITVNATPKVVFTALGSICQEVSPIQFTQAADVSGSNGKGVYSGAGVTATGLFSPAAAGVGVHAIKYVFTSTSGCADSVTQNIIVNATPTVDAGVNKSIHIGESITLSPKATGNNITYKWTPATGLSNPNIAQPVATPSDDIIYRLTVTSADSCSAMDTVSIRILKIPIIPNTFTPNNDGINDVWNIQNLDRYPDCIMDIYNRYGMLMFHSTGYGIAWDGRYKGEEVPVGTYYYVLNLKDGTKNYGGYVTIIR
ncbi:MAG: PKD domain-containing protein [Janthinobacterium lividum]